MTSKEQIVEELLRDALPVKKIHFYMAFNLNAEHYIVLTFEVDGDDPGYRLGIFEFTPGREQPSAYHLETVDRLVAVYGVRNETPMEHYYRLQTGMINA